MRASRGPRASAREARPGLRRTATRLLEHLPPGPAWALWRIAAVPAAALRRHARAPRVAVAAVAWGIDEYELLRLIERLSPTAGAPDRLLVISDSDAVHLAAGSGCRFEHVPPSRDRQARPAGRDHDEFAVRRIDALLGDYRVERVLAVGELPAAVRDSLPQGARPELPPVEARAGTPG